MTGFNPMPTTRWAWKRVNADGTSKNNFRWPVGTGGWVAEDGPKNGKPWGRGLHLAKTWAGASLRGCLTGSIGLLVAYEDGDVLGEDDDVVRVRRAWVQPKMLTDLVDAARRASRSNLTAADFTLADFTGANLTGVNLSRAPPRSFTPRPFPNRHNHHLISAGLFTAGLVSSLISAGLFTARFAAWAAPRGGGGGGGGWER